MNLGFVPSSIPRKLTAEQKVQLDDAITVKAKSDGKKSYIEMVKADKQAITDEGDFWASKIPKQMKIYLC